MEVKGVIAEFIAQLSHPKISLFAMKIGVDPTGISGNEIPKLRKTVFILSMSNADAEIIIKAAVDSIKKDAWNKSELKGLIEQLNFVLERTMNCQVDENGELIPIFELGLGLNEKQSYLERKLNEFGFITALSHYKGAIDSYRASPKGSISLLRASYESMVEEILVKESIPLASNFKDNLKNLTNLSLLKELDIEECASCHYRKRDSEFNFGYNIYSLLSNYGSHTDLVTDHVANWLYTCTSSFLWFLINRYEKRT